jgi:hypothetical protein
LNQQVFFPKIKKAPKGAGHKSSQDEDKVPRKDVDSCVEGSRQEITRYVSPSFHQTILEKSTPEDFLSRTGDEEQKQKDQDPICPHSQRINRSHLGFSPRKNVRGNFVPKEKNKVEDGGRQKPEEEGAESKRYFWPLPE